MDPISAVTWHERSDAFAQAILGAQQGGEPVEISIGTNRYVLNGWCVGGTDPKVRAFWVEKAELRRRSKIPAATRARLRWLQALGVVRRRIVRAR